MSTAAILKQHGLTHLVKDIFVFENTSDLKKDILPFFADGFPGIVFQTSRRAVLLPSKKILSEFFLYGQTIHPIEIILEAPYKMIVFQLYPFVAKALFKVNTKELNDDCYDLQLVQGAKAKQTISLLKSLTDTNLQVDRLMDFLKNLMNKKINATALKTNATVSLIIQHKGIITVKELCDQLFINERTLQRNFIEYVGISPKQFAKIIQFQSSFEHFSEETFSKLSEIVYDNGYTDQSHFIRNFKKYTGKKPSAFKNQK